MSRFRNSVPLDCKVYVGDLGDRGTRHELENAFSCFGPLRKVWIARNPPGFAFVEFEDPEDAENAVLNLDGTILCGRRVRVELTNKGSRSQQGFSPRNNSVNRCYSCGDSSHYARDCRIDRNTVDEQDDLLWHIEDEIDYSDFCPLGVHDDSVSDDDYGAYPELPDMTIYPSSHNSGNHTSRRTVNQSSRTDGSQHQNVTDGSQHQNVTDTSQHQPQLSSHGFQPEPNNSYGYQPVQSNYVPQNNSYGFQQQYRTDSSQLQHNSSVPQVFYNSYGYIVHPMFGGYIPQSIIYGFQQQPIIDRPQLQHNSCVPQAQNQGNSPQAQHSNSGLQQHHSTRESPQQPRKSIETSTPSQSPTARKLNTSDDVKCSICLDTTFDSEMEFITCGHSFHAKCCNNWLKVNNVCPMCRTVIEPRRAERCYPKDPIRRKFHRCLVAATRHLCNSGKLCQRKLLGVK